MGAEENFHESAFAGAIFTDKSQDFAGVDVEIDAVEGACGAEGLANAEHAQARPRILGGGRGEIR
jgi:hypothetical protein